MGTQILKGRPETGKFAAGIRHPSQSSGLRFPFDLMFSFRVAGGRGFSIQPSTQSSIQSSPFRFSPLSSVIDSVICHRFSHRFIPGGGRSYPIQPSIQPSTQSSIQSSIQLCRDAVPTLPKPCAPPILDTPYSILSMPPTPSPIPLGLQMRGFDSHLQAESGTFPLADC